MIRIHKFDEYHKLILNLNAPTFQLIIKDKKLSLVIATRPRPTTIEYPHPVEFRDVTVEYNFIKFKSLVRIAEKNEMKSISLRNDLQLSYGASPITLTYSIKGVEK